MFISDTRQRIKLVNSKCVFPTLNMAVSLYGTEINVQVLEFLIKNLYGYKYCNSVHLCANTVNSLSSSYKIEKYAGLFVVLCKYMF
jgi:hypothetical protein